MPKRINMPKLSDTMEEGVLLSWRKKAGDTIKRGEILAEIETDKADMEFESYTEGKVYALFVEPSQTVRVGTPIALIQLAGDTDEDMQAALGGGGGQPTERAAAKPAPAPAAAPTEAPATKAAAARPRAARAAVAAPSRPVVAPPEPPRPAPAAVGGERVTPESLEDDRVRATPRARRFAEEKSVDLHEVEGSGPDGAILVADIETYLARLETQNEEQDGVRATPLALRVAADLGIDLEHVKGTGPGGRITRSDVMGQLKRDRESSKARERELFRGALQLSQKRKALIRNMVRSKEEAPHFYIMMDVRTDALKELRDRLNREAQEGPGARPRLTYTHMMIKACALALEASPEVNATYRADEHDIALFESINIGLAVDVNDELVAPTIKDCQGKDLWQLADESNALVQRARMRKLQPQDYADGTFTISNLGMLGVDRFYAIITPPQSSILSVGAMAQRPIVENGQLAVGNLVTLGLSVDHRVLDGARAAQFLGEIRRLLEHPEELIKDGSAGN